MLFLCEKARVNHNMKKYFYIFIFIFCVVHTNAQITYPWLNNFNDPVRTDVMVNVATLKNSNLLFMGWRGVTTNTNNVVPYKKINPILFKTTFNGTFISSKEFTKLGNTYIQFISNVFESNADDSLVLIGDGLHELDSIPTVVFIKCDTNFNTGTIKTYPMLSSPTLPYYFDTYQNGGGGLFKKHPDGGYYGVINTMKIISGPNYSDSPFFQHYYRFDNSGNVIHQGHTQMVWYYERRSDVEFSTTLKQYVSIDNTREAYLMDSTFALIKYNASDVPWWSTADDHIQAHGVRTILPYKGKHLVAGNFYHDVTFAPFNYFDYGYLNLVLYDDHFDTIKKYYYSPIFGDSGLNKITANFKTMDYINEDSIFITYYPEMQQAVFTYTVFMIDSNFKVKWAHIDTLEYLDRIESIKATPDGGCIIVGSTVMGFNADMFVIKYEKSGMRSSIRFINNDMTDITIYPNPASDKIFISGETQNRNFILYNTQGIQVITANDNELTNGIHINTLKTGLYFYRITDKITGAVKTGKWIKSE